MVLRDHYRPRWKIPTLKQISRCRVQLITVASLVGERAYIFANELHKLAQRQISDLHNIPTTDL
jgi:hypothetical protein